MQLKLNRKENFSISTYLNDKPISTPDWEVFVDDENNTEDQFFIVVRDPQTGNQLKIQIKNYINYENIETTDIVEHTDDGVQESEE
jgi:CRISPR/Cas system CSM-associated protein Csm5 (group 7 of RAMP superfamily)